METIWPISWHGKPRWFVIESSLSHATGSFAAMALSHSLCSIYCRSEPQFPTSPSGQSRIRTQDLWFGEHQLGCSVFLEHLMVFSVKFLAKRMRQLEKKMGSFLYFLGGWPSSSRLWFLLSFSSNLYWGPFLIIFCYFRTLFLRGCVFLAKQQQKPTTINWKGK